MNTARKAESMVQELDDILVDVEAAVAVPAGLPQALLSRLALELSRSIKALEPIAAELAALESKRHRGATRRAAIKPVAETVGGD